MSLERREEVPSECILKSNYVKYAANHFVLQDNLSVRYIWNPMMEDLEF